jgi:L-amino acid N-acyltransferase YncA
MTTQIRVAEPVDAPEIVAIYAPYILHTSTSFEYDVPTVDEFSARIENGLRTLPWLVCDHDGSIIGYSYATHHRERKAYQWSVETSVYVKEGFHGKGVALTLYTALFNLLKKQGFVNAYAGISQPNSRSVAFHSKCGFTDVGLYKKVGYKAGAWHDVLWMHLMLTEPPLKPENPVPFSMLVSSFDHREILQQLTQSLKL